MIVNIDQLAKVISSLLLKLKEQKGNEVELNNDYYWDIPESSIYDPYKKPKELTLGQLSFDLERLEELQVSNENSIPYDLQKLANIIKALSIENGSAF